MRPLQQFLLVQAANAPLIFLGLFICLVPRLAKKLRWWWNDDDPPQASWSYWRTWYWLAWRNPADNTKHWKWTQRVDEKTGVGGPLKYKTWSWLGKQMYAKAGWMSDKYCCMSAGFGRGY